MPKPTLIEFFDGDNITTELEELTEVKIGKKRLINVRVTSGDNANHRSGLIIRYFAKVDGIPVATFVHVSNQDNNGQSFNTPKNLRVIRGTQQSVRAIAWDRRNPPAGGGEIQSRRVRLKATK